MGAAQLLMCALGLEILVGGLGNIKLSGMAAQLSKLGCLLFGAPKVRSRTLMVAAGLCGSTESVVC